MISWKLWQALKHPPEAHPVYQRTLATYRKGRRTITLSKKQKSGIQLNSTVRRILIVLAWIAGGWFTAQGLGMVTLMPTFAMVFMVPVFANIYGAQIAIQISGNIAREREQGTYDLLKVTPLGTLGTNWAIANGYLHHDQRYKDTCKFVEPISLFSAIMLAFAAVFGLTNIGNPSLSPLARMPELPLLYLGGIGIISAAFIEITHAIGMAVMLGILIPNSMKGNFNGYIAALGSFLSLQVLVYVPTLAIGRVILPNIFRATGIPNLIADVSAATVMLAIFCILRVRINALLWRIILQRLNVDVTEASMVLQ